MVQETRGRKGEDITGMVFGAMTALHWVEGSRPRVWQFRCDCGNLTTCSVAKARKGMKRSCGCGILRVGKLTKGMKLAMERQLRAEQLEAQKRLKAEQLAIEKAMKREMAEIRAREAAEMAAIRAKEQAEKRAQALILKEERRLAKIVADEALRLRREEALRLRSEREAALEERRKRDFDASGRPRKEYKLPNWFANVPAKKFAKFETKPVDRTFVAMVSHVEKQELEQLLDGLKRFYDR